MIIFVTLASIYGLPVGVCSHLDIQPAGSSLPGMVSATPVADDCSIEAPLFLEDSVKERVVLTAPHVVPFVIGAHDGPQSSLLHCFLERRQIDFVYCPFAHVDVGVPSSLLLVVEEEVFETAGHAVGLSTLDIRYDNLTSEVGVFACIFKASSVEGHTRDGASRTENNIFSAIDKLFAHRMSILPRQCSVEGGSQTGE